MRERRKGNGRNVINASSYRVEQLMLCIYIVWAKLTYSKLYPVPTVPLLKNQHVAF